MAERRRRFSAFMVRGGLARHCLTTRAWAFPESFALTRLHDAVQWARKYSFFSYPFVTACCGMEYFSVAGPRYDIDRFGAALPRFTPRQADLLFVVGTITQRQAPNSAPRVGADGGAKMGGIVRRLHQFRRSLRQLRCASGYRPHLSGRRLHSRMSAAPEAVLDGLIKLHPRPERTSASTVVQSPWQRTQAD